MIKISILGAGKVAHHLILHILEQDNLELQQIYARNKNKVTSIVPKALVIDNLADLVPADVIIIAVSDDAITEVSSAIPLHNQLVVHTSGTAPLEAIKHTDRKGVFYMLQTFSKEKPIDFTQVPFCIEASNQEDFNLLEKIALTFGERVYVINSTQRKAIHLAATFVNNFTNHLCTLGEEICTENNVPFEILKPLIKETASKLEVMSPKEAQTGPASRKDESTIQQHLTLLKDDHKKEIYQLLTNSILKNNA